LGTIPVLFGTLWWAAFRIGFVDRYLNKKSSKLSGTMYYLNSEPETCLFISIFASLNNSGQRKYINALFLQDSRCSGDGILGVLDCRTADSLDFGMFLIVDHPYDCSCCVEQVRLCGNSQ
jgi:hypothetical protein